MAAETGVALPARRDAVQGLSDVFVAARPFTSFGGDLMQRLSPEAKSLMVDAGICHYMTILREPSGRLVQYDFGPIGGDIAVAPCIEQAASVSKQSGDELSATGQKRKQKAIQGEIRITALSSLPETSMYVGTTTYGARDIEQFNRTRSTIYQLNVNDCRHYTNKLVQEATGVDSIATRLVRHQFRHRRSHSLRPVDYVFHPIQTLTNADNWPAIQLSAYTAAAAAVATVGHPLVGPPLATCSMYTWPYVVNTAARAAGLARKLTGVASQRLAQHKHESRALARASRIVLCARESLVRRQADSSLMSLHEQSLSRRAVQRVSHSFAGVTHAFSGASHRMVHGLARRARAVQWRAQLPRRPASSQRMAPLASLTMRMLPQHRAGAVALVERTAPQCAACSGGLPAPGSAVVQQRSGVVHAAQAPLRRAFSKESFVLSKSRADVPYLRLPLRAK